MKETKEYQEGLEACKYKRNLINTILKITSNYSQENEIRKPNPPPPSSSSFQHKHKRGSARDIYFDIIRAFSFGFASRLLWHMDTCTARVLGSRILTLRI